MAGLVEFFARLDRQAEADELPDVPTDADLDATAALLLPIFARWAERAGLDLREVIPELQERVRQPAALVQARIEHGQEELGDGLRMVAGAAALQFFLAGVLWEQGRALPDLGDLDDAS